MQTNIYMNASISVICYKSKILSNGKYSLMLYILKAMTLIIYLPQSEYSI